MKTLKILSIDGGGVRGLIPATILAEIERQTGQSISELFDLIAGTSTGGILALGLTKPGINGKPQYQAKDLIQLYGKEGNQIFDAGVFNAFDGILDKMNAAPIEMLVSRKYSSQGIESVLTKYFGDTNLSEALNEVLITSYDIEKRKPYFFKRYQAIASKNCDFPMKCVARATSAAPTYFSPCKLKVADSYYALIDGGVFANNPALCAYAEAKRLYPDAEVLIVSLGTGELVNRIFYDKARTWGLIQWAPSILDITFDGVSDSVDYQLQQILNSNDDHPKRYYRFQSDRLEHGDHMDDARPSNLKFLRDVAEEILDKQMFELKALCRQLTQTEVTA